MVPVLIFCDQLASAEGADQYHCACNQYYQRYDLFRIGHRWNSIGRAGGYVEAARLFPDPAGAGWRDIHCE